MRHISQKNIGPDDSGPIMSLTPEHVRLLELLSTGLTIYEAGALMEIEPTCAERLRRQAYIRLGVMNLKDAIAASGIEVPKEKPVKPTNVNRPRRLSKQEHQEESHRIFVKLFGSIFEDEEVSPIGKKWPDFLWLFHYPASGKYHCLESPDGVTGMVCCSSVEFGKMFIEEAIDKTEFTDDCILIGVSFDSAREIVIAKSGVQALLLLDDPDGLLCHYVC